MHRYFSTDELLQKADTMGHDHFDVYDETRRTLLLVINGAKDGMKKGEAGEHCQNFIERAGGSFLVETRSANSGNARKVITYVQCKKTFKAANEKQPDNPPQQQPVNGFSAQSVDERIDQAINSYKQEQRIKDLEDQVNRHNDKKERHGEWLDMAFDGLVKGIKKHYPYAPMNGGNATVNDANFNGYQNSDSPIDDALDDLIEIFGEDTLIKLAHKLKTNPDPGTVSMVKNYANK